MLAEWKEGKEVRDIVERIVGYFPEIFEGFDPEGIYYFILPEKKTKSRYDAAKLVNFTFPTLLATQKPYMISVSGLTWNDLNDRQKNTLVFRLMCGIPYGGFDINSEMYAKKIKPEVNMHLMELAVTGGVVDWMDASGADDPLSVTEDKVRDRIDCIHHGDTGDALPAMGGDAVRTPVGADSLSGV